MLLFSEYRFHHSCIHPHLLDFCSCFLITRIVWSKLWWSVIIACLPMARSLEFRNCLRRVLWVKVWILSYFGRSWLLWSLEYITLILWNYFLGKILSNFPRKWSSLGFLRAFYESGFQYHWFYQTGLSSCLSGPSPNVCWAEVGRYIPRISEH